MKYPILVFKIVQVGQHPFKLFIINLTHIESHNYCELPKAKHDTLHIHNHAGFVTM